MSTTIAARGNDALLGISLDEPGLNSSLGHPRFEVAPITAPAAPTVAIGGAGNITAAGVLYKVSFLSYFGETNVSAASTDPGALTSDEVDLSAIPLSASADVWGRKIYRSVDGGTTWHWIHTLYDNTTETWTDDISATASYLEAVTPPATTQIGKNGGFLFLYPASFNLDADYKVIDAKELRGSVGQPRGAAGNIDVPLAIKEFARAGYLVHALALLMGKPTVTENADGTCTYVFSPNVSKLSPVSGSFLIHEGGSVRPEMFLAGMASELALDIKGGAIVDADTKGAAQHHTKSGMPEIVTTTTYKLVPAIRGIRQDSNRATGDLFVKVTTAPSGGTFKIKVKTATGESYGSYDITVTYDTTTKKQTKGNADSSDWVELIDSTTGARLGADTGEVRRPLQICFPGDCSTLALNDEFKIPYRGAVPGVGTTPGTADGTYTGFAARSVPAPRFTMSHGYIKRGTVSANNVLQFNSAKASLKWPPTMLRSIGAEAATIEDIDRNDFLGLDLDIQRRFTSREFEDLMETDGRLVAQFKLEGELIPIQPNTRSTLRESVIFDITQARVSNTSSPVSGPGIVMESLKLEAEQPEDLSTAHFTVTVHTRQHVKFRT